VPTLYKAPRWASQRILKSKGDTQTHANLTGGGSRILAGRGIPKESLLHAGLGKKGFLKKEVPQGCIAFKRMQKRKLPPG
jgi:hypothetical protein